MCVRMSTMMTSPPPPVQLYTYQRSFMTKFSMVSSRLDLEQLVSQQRLREAFSNADLSAAKHLHSELDSFQEVCVCVCVCVCVYI